jgi:plasmid stabilization system protein ParE
VRLIWSPLADAQVDDAVAYIAADEPAAARAWLERLLERVRSLADYPDSGRMVPELQREDVRELIVPPYRVIYRRTADAVEIAALRHGARHFDEGGLAR